MQMQRMHVVIGGYGRVGRFLAHELEEAGHTVAVIDRSHLAFEDADAEMIGAQLVGQVFDKDILEEAGIERADVFAAVTAGDNSNILSARIAKEHYRVPRVVARIYGPQRAEIYRGLGIPTVASVVWASARLLDMILHPELHSVYQYGNAELEMLEAVVPEQYVGKRVTSLEVPGEIHVVAVLRGHAGLLPSVRMEFEAGDVVYINALRECVPRLEQMLGMGGGR